jgi:hypothetical protein
MVINGPSVWRHALSPSRKFGHIPHTAQHTGFHQLGDPCRATPARLVVGFWL